MNSAQLFTQALGLLSPWYVERIEFNQDSKGRFDNYVRFENGSKLKDEDGNECPAHDTLERSWQHLNFFEYTCYLHAKVPRIKTVRAKSGNWSFLVFVRTVVLPYCLKLMP